MSDKKYTTKRQKNTTKATIYPHKKSYLCLFMIVNVNFPFKLTLTGVYFKKGDARQMFFPTKCHLCSFSSANFNVTLELGIRDYFTFTIKKATNFPIFINTKFQSDGTNFTDVRYFAFYYKYVALIFFLYQAKNS